MILCYVAGPFTSATREGVEANIRRAVDLGVEVAKLGAYPVIPHSNTADPRFEQVQPYQFWIAATLAMLEGCGALITVEGWEKSTGARGEVEWMRARDRSVFHTLPELAAYLDSLKGPPSW
jgi:hypothetical protein